MVSVPLTNHVRRKMPRHANFPAFFLSSRLPSVGFCHDVLSVVFIPCSPLWEMVQEGIDIKTIQWSQHWLWTTRLPSYSFKLWCQSADSPRSSCVLFSIMAIISFVTGYWMPVTSFEWRPCFIQLLFQTPKMKIKGNELWSNSDKIGHKIIIRN